MIWLGSIFAVTLLTGIPIVFVLGISALGYFVLTGQTNFLLVLPQRMFAGVDQFDPSPANNTASVAILPQQADLALTGVVDIARPNVGDVVNFTWKSSVLPGLISAAVSGCGQVALRFAASALAM